MSPSWHNRLYVAISPERISMIKLGRGLKPKLQARHDEVIAPVGKQPPWQAALDRLAQLLSQPEWQKAEVKIVLSNRLVRFAPITFNAQLNNYSVKESFARHVMTQTFGPAIEQSALRIDLGKNGGTSLVGAVDQALLDGLGQACTTHQHRLSMVTPYLATVFNQFSASLTIDPAWLVINEPDYSLIALLNEGEFITVNGIHHNGLDELPVLLDREDLVSSLAEPCKSVYLCAPSCDDLKSIPPTGYDFNKLDIAVPNGFPPQSEGLYAMAMSEFL